MVNEKGDGFWGFRKEVLPFKVSDNGLITIQSFHLSSYAIAVSEPDIPDDEVPEPEPLPDQETCNSGSGCFIDSSRFF